MGADSIYMRTHPFIIAVFLIVCCHAVSYGEVTLEKIVVKPSSFYSPYKGIRQNYNVDSVSSPDIQSYESSPINGPLDYVSGFDLRSRGAFGIQADPSIRGSTYEEVAVLIDGVKVMDPQTGHYNLDIPLTRFDLERIDIMKEPASSFYGAGAFAGAVNLVTRKPAADSFQTEYLFGEHALHQEGISLSRVHDDLSLRASYEHASAKAAVPNTDFEYKTGSLYVDKDMGDLDFDTLLGYQKKDYGAGSFYSNLFPEEEEHTETVFSRSSMRYNLNPGSVLENFYFRKHRDKFILARNNPTSVNYHTTYVYGLNSQLRLPVRGAELIAGVDTASDEINSSNLGKHKRFNQAFIAGVVPDLGERLSADVRLRTDYYEDWDWNQSFNAGMGYWFIRDVLKVRSSAARAFRIPTFTELYYRDAANRGNSQLVTEESDHISAGLLFNYASLSLHLDGYFRKAANVIDWTRFNAADPWQATNLGRVNFKGVECGLGTRSLFTSRLLSVDQWDLSYNYGEADYQTSGVLSKYALDILKHQVLLVSGGRVFNFNFSCHLSYHQRRFGESYFLGDIIVSRKIKRNGFVFEPFIAVDNVADTHYSEVGGVIQPGRWLKSGVRFTW